MQKYRFCDLTKPCARIYQTDLVIRIILNVKNAVVIGEQEKESIICSSME